MTDRLEDRLASPAKLARFILIFVGAFLVLNLAFALIRSAFPSSDIPKFWPVSEVIPAVSGFFTLARLGMVALSLAIVACGISFVYRDRLSVPLALLLGLVLAVATNGILGRQEGYAGPVAGQSDESPQYYDDALGVHDARRFIAEYTDRQPEYSTHTKTHPPGPVLVMYGGIKTGIGPETIGIVLGLGSLLALGGCLCLAFRRTGLADRDVAWWLLLVLSLPAVQIYTIYSIDATIAACSAALLLASLLEPTWARVGLGALALIALLSLSFGSLVFLAVVPILWRWRGRSWSEIVWIGVPVALFFAVAHLALGYNYLASMLTASRLENPQGFRLLADPVSYLATRFENVAEPILFAGPIGALFAVEWWRSRHRSSPESRALVLLLGLLGVAFLTGAYRTGETARACLFVVPFAALALAKPASEALTASKVRAVSVLLVGLQAIVMQSLARFYW
ncbi:MAG: hypothetical protein KIS66_16485 [Fimbriimonadaceae bacterium]|nr:hypothetical protein [Fimbriimonadaceae bacterium]